MSADPILLTRRWAVGDHIVTLRVPRPTPGRPLEAFCVWDPAMPKSLSPTDQAAYERGRNDAIAEVARMLQKGPQ